MKKYILKYTVVCLGLIILFSCGENKGIQPARSKPTAFGRINDVVIIADKNIQNSQLRDTLSDYFEAPYPILTAYEPLFDMRFMTVEDLLAKPLRRELRTFVVVADLSDTLSSVTRMLRDDLGKDKFQSALNDSSFNISIGKDKWARDQIIFYVFGNGQGNIAAALRQHFPTIAKRINQHDQKSLQATVYGIKEPSASLSKLVFDSFGIQIKIPGTCQVAMNLPNFTWLRMDNKIINQSMVIRKVPYENTSQFSKEYVIQMRNEYGKEFIKTQFDDAYMSTNVVDLPIYDYRYIHNGIYTYEVRGIWETVNDFMGGPYISYLLHNERSNELIFIDVFVYAPGEQKRDLLQQLDCIVKTARL